MTEFIFGDSCELLEIPRKKKLRFALMITITFTLLYAAVVLAYFSAHYFGVAYFSTSTEIRITLSVVSALVLGALGVFCAIYSIMNRRSSEISLVVEPVRSGLELEPNECEADVSEENTKLIFQSGGHFWHVAQSSELPDNNGALSDSHEAIVRFSMPSVVDQFGDYSQFMKIVSRANSVEINLPNDGVSMPSLRLGLHITDRADILRFMASPTALKSGFGSAFFTYYTHICRNLLIASGRPLGLKPGVLSVDVAVFSLLSSDARLMLEDIVKHRAQFGAVLEFWREHCSQDRGMEIKILQALFDLIGNGKLLQRFTNYTHTKNDANLGHFAVIYALLLSSDVEESFLKTADRGELLHRELQNFLCHGVAQTKKYVAACLDYGLGGILCEKFQDAQCAHSRCFRVLGLLTSSYTTEGQLRELYDTDLRTCMSWFHDIPALRGCHAYSYMAQIFTESTGLDLLDAARANNTLRYDSACNDGGITKEASTMLFNMCRRLGFTSVTSEALTVITSKAVSNLCDDVARHICEGVVLHDYECYAEIPAICGRVAVTNQQCQSIFGTELVLGEDECMLQGVEVGCSHVK
ncbi:MAG: hypothetical protein ACTJLL_00525 [Anaplasma sp.]